MNRKLLKEKVEAVTARSDVIAFCAEVLEISKSSAAMKLRGDAPLSINQACKIRDALHLTSSDFSKIFLED